jgi:hypothetical protein
VTEAKVNEFPMTFFRLSRQINKASTPQRPAVRKVMRIRVKIKSFSHQFLQYVTDQNKEVRFLVFYEVLLILEDVGRSFYKQSCVS